MHPIIERIKAARLKSGMSQADLAARLGISAGAVGKWEAGYSKPEIDRLADIASHLRVDLKWLMDGLPPDQRGLTLEKILNPGFQTTEAPTMHNLPVVNKIAANHQAAFTNVRETHPVDVKYDRTNHYCLMVKGRSMHPTIMEGDVVIVRRMFMQMDPYDPSVGPANKSEWMKLNKKVVCAVVDDEEPELKRLFVQEARKKETGFFMYLRGDNPQSRMITIELETSLKIVGVVQQIMRDPGNFE